MSDKISDCLDLEIAAQQFQDAVALAYIKTVPSQSGRTAGINHGGTKTWRRKEGKYENY
jgi:hypothetical protein